jgi:protocatechuate 3,4-dioxygenase alpha subunit
VPDLTPFQTVGPFFHCALPFASGDTLVTNGRRGAVIVIEGTVRDGGGSPVSDALVEIWQANAAGRYNHPDDPGGALVDPSFDGFGRTPTDDNGRFSFVTIKPGPVPGPNGRMQAPHVLVGILGRGILTRLVTRIYFEDEPANERDPILEFVSIDRRPTLIARRETEGRYRYDIVLQGHGETVFFDV